MKRKKLERAIDLIKEGVTQNFHLTDLHTAMTIMHKFWANMDEVVILNCFKRTGLFTLQSISESEKEQDISINLIPNNVLDSGVEK